MRSIVGERPFRGNRRMLLLQVIDDEPRPPRQLNDKIPRDLEVFGFSVFHLGDSIFRELVDPCVRVGEQDG